MISLDLGKHTYGLKTLIIDMKWSSDQGSQCFFEQLTVLEKRRQEQRECKIDVFSFRRSARVMNVVPTFSGKPDIALHRI
jgi:hypothetical protein